MGGRQEINLDTITPLVSDTTMVGAVGINDTVASDSLSVASVVTTKEIQPVNAATNVDSGGTDWVGWIGVGLSVCLGIAVWKIYGTLTKEIKSLRHKLDSDSKIVDKLMQQIDNLEQEIKLQKQLLKSKLEQQSRAVNTNVKSGGQNIVNRNSEKAIKHNKTVKYATLQSPDESGVLRFSERSMVDEASPEKMFIVEVDSQSGSGTYRINPLARNLILGDLQLFREFVKSFNFSGDTTKVMIEDVVPGKIHRQGNFWVVEQLLEISIY